MTQFQRNVLNMLREITAGNPPNWIGADAYDIALKMEAPHRSGATANALKALANAGLVERTCPIRRPGKYKAKP